MSVTTKSCACPSKKKQSRRRSAFPLLSGLFIALLPKCPWCILAYSSAITMCSGTKFYMPTNSWTTYLPIAFAIITLLLVLTNFRGKRTYLASLLIVLGSALLLHSTFYYGEENAYYLGTFLVLFGVWVNGSFYYFFNKIKQQIQLQKSNA